MIKGPHVRRTRAWDAGSCNFCTERREVVYEVFSEHPTKTLSVRVCSPCAVRLKEEIRCALRRDPPAPRPGREL